jgi:predicted CxxxxCH...CXXCH cytochrome family protein
VRAPHWLLVAALALVAQGCFVSRDRDQQAGTDGTCTNCHGDSSRDGTAVRRAAPPVDVHGNTGVDYPGVGAHELHLSASTTHAALDCTECHAVPKTVDAAGHNVGKTAFTFGPLAIGDGGFAPSYDFATRRCTNSYCHAATSGVWTDARTSKQACGSCHSLPPPAPHPQAGRCAACHPDVINDQGEIINPSLHVNGTVDVSKAACDSCHGHDDGGAPPVSLDGGTLVTQLGVGAHAAHLAGGAHSRPVKCEECHVVPEKPVTLQHPNGGMAELTFSGVANANGAVSAWSEGTQTCTTWCHQANGDGGVSPQWTREGTSLSCQGCHGAPPPAPHPQVKNCALCHPNSTGSDGLSFLDRTLHIDGQIQAGISSQCNACHGSSTNNAPPRDTWGNTATTALGVGAHQSHLVGHGLARQVKCEECHLVPQAPDAGGHLNGSVEVVFSGVAKAYLATPSYTTGTCANTACHDISNITQADGGGTASTPVWTIVDGSQRTCTSCHGFPPPLPHEQRSDCSTCHLNATAQNTFVRPELHVNGHVEFGLPDAGP